MRLALCRDTITYRSAMPTKKAAITDKQFAAIARALAEPRRVEILRQLGRTAQATPCSALHEAAKVSAATMSHHVHELAAAGLIQMEREGKFMNISLQRDVLKAYLERLAAI